MGQQRRARSTAGYFDSTVCSPDPKMKRAARRGSQAWFAGGRAARRALLLQVQEEAARLDDAGGGDAAAAAASVDPHAEEERVALNLSASARVYIQRPYILTAVDLERRELRTCIVAAVRLSGSMSASQVVQILATFGRLARGRMAGGVAVVDPNEWRTYTAAAVRWAGSMNAAQVSHTLSAFLMMAESGLVVDADAVRDVTVSAVRLARSTNPDRVAEVLGAFGKIIQAKSGLDVDYDAVRVVTAAAVEGSDSMSPAGVASVLGALGRFAKSGAGVTPVSVRAFTDAAIRVSVDMDRYHVPYALTAVVNLAESGLVAVDPLAVQALRDAAARVADDMRDEQRTDTLSALATLTGLGFDATGARAPSGGLSPSAAEATTPADPAPDPDSDDDSSGDDDDEDEEMEDEEMEADALAAAADSWLAVLPSGKRATLELQLDAAATVQDKWDILRRSAEDLTAIACDVCGADCEAESWLVNGEVGRCKLDSVVTHSLQAAGFQTLTLGYQSWFKEMCISNSNLRLVSTLNLSKVRN
jgi:hypothetical protein